MKLAIDTSSTLPRASSPEVSPKDMTNKKRQSMSVHGSTSTMNLGELPNGISSSKRGHTRSDSQVWQPRDASWNQRPPWASIGHHAIVPWRSSSRLEGERRIRVVEGSDGSEYDAETDSIWDPLEGDTGLLQQKSEREEDEHADEAGHRADWLRTPKARAKQAVMPLRCPPSPPTSATRQDSLTVSLHENLEKDAHIPKVKAKNSRFIEHVDENAEMLRSLGIAYEEAKRRRISDWFNSLARR